TYVVCPPPGMDPVRLTHEHPSFIGLLESTGARLIVLDPYRHDQIAATVSHLPQLLAVALTDFAAERNREDEAFLQLAAGGFRDMTRVASSPFDVWRDIIMANNGPILDALAGFAAQLQRVRNRVAADVLHGAGRRFESARRTQANRPRLTNGVLQPVAEGYVDA